MNDKSELVNFSTFLVLKLLTKSKHLRNVCCPKDSRVIIPLDKMFAYVLTPVFRKHLNVAWPYSAGAAGPCPISAWAGELGLGAGTGLGQDGLPTEEMEGEHCLQGVRE